MKSYYKVMLGKKSMYMQECTQGSFIGVHYGMDIDFTHTFPEDWKDFNKQFIPIYQANNPGKTKIAAGLACGAIWTMGKGIQTGDIIVSPDGRGTFLFAEVTGDYEYHPAQILPHRRPVRWFDSKMPRKDTSDDLRSSTTSVGTIANISAHAAEIERYLSGETTSAAPL